MKNRRKYNGDIFIPRTKNKISVSRFADKLSRTLENFKTGYCQFLRYCDYSLLKYKNKRKINRYRNLYTRKSNFTFKFTRLISSCLTSIGNFFATHKVSFKRVNFNKINFRNRKVMATLSTLGVLVVLFTITSNLSKKDNKSNSVAIYTNETNMSPLEYDELVDTIAIYNAPNEMVLASSIKIQEKERSVESFYDALINDHTLDGDGTIGIEYDEYEVKEGDNLSTLSLKIGATLDTIVSVNKITNANRLRPGAKLIIPNRNGLLYTVGKGETLEDISEKYDVSVKRIMSFNKIESIEAGQDLFLPGARYTLDERIEKFGQIFNLPLDRITRVSSDFGYRTHPITGVRTLHRGIDFPGALNTPVYAARGGTVTFAGYSGGGFGNLVIIKHKDGYTTYYGHLNSVTTRAGQKVGVGSLIGRMGSTGRSTGSHLHLEIRRNGVAVNPNEYIPVKRYLRK